MTRVHSGIGSVVSSPATSLDNTMRTIKHIRANSGDLQLSGRQGSYMIKWTSGNLFDRTVARKPFNKNFLLVTMILQLPSR